MQTHTNTLTHTHVDTWKFRNTFGPLSDLLKGIESHVREYLGSPLRINQNLFKYESEPSRTSLHITS